MCICVINCSTTAEAKSKIASGKLSIMREKGIEAGVSFIAAFAMAYLNRHMAWFGATDPNIGTAAYLTFHRTTRYYIMARDIKRLDNGNWKTNPKFDDFRKVLAELTTEERSLLEELPEKYFKTALSQVHKHNNRYFRATNLLKAAFGEFETGKWVIALVLLDRLQVDENSNLVLDQNGFNGSFESPSHDTIIDIKDWVQFLYDGTKDVINELRESSLVTQFRPYLEKIANGLDGFTVSTYTDPEDEEDEEDDSAGNSNDGEYSEGNTAGLAFVVLLERAAVVRRRRRYSRRRRRKKKKKQKKRRIPRRRQSACVASERLACFCC